MSLPGDRDQTTKELESLREKLHQIELSQAMLRQAEARLQASEQKYRTIFDNTGAATILIDADTTISMANNEFVKLTGYTLDEIEGRMTWVDFIDQEDRERMLAYHYSRRINPASAPRNYECVLINREGRKLTCMLTVAIIPETSQSIASFLDLTDMREAEAALRAKEEQYRLLVETMNDGLGVQDERGVITYVNNRICEILGYSREELLGRRSFDFLSDDSKSTWQGEMIRRKINRHEPYEVTWQNRRGEQIVTIVSPRPILDSAGKYAGSFSFTRSETSASISSRTSGGTRSSVTNST